MFRVSARGFGGCAFKVSGSGAIGLGFEVYAGFWRLCVQGAGCKLGSGQDLVSLRQQCLSEPPAFKRIDFFISTDTYICFYLFIYIYIYYTFV